MKLNNSNADIYIPEGTDIKKALPQTTHMCIVAHQDDTEIAAYHGVAECFGQKDKWFTSVIVTNGAGSPRAGIYSECTDQDMQNIRRKEQRKAAFVGEYIVQIQLDYPSSAVKDPKNKNVITDIYSILETAQPEILYLHNPADKHDTHVATIIRAIEAIRRLPKDKQPKKILGCEVWRDLDWMQDSEKVVLDVSASNNISASILSLFDSQISGGKRYDLATAGRRLANATYFASHDTDDISAITYAIDLTPLIKDTNLSIKTFILDTIERFKSDVSTRLDKLM